MKKIIAILCVLLLLVMAFPAAGKTIFALGTVAPATAEKQSGLVSSLAATEATKHKAPSRDLEDMKTAQIVVSRIRKLPRNFNDVGRLSWSADGKRLLVDRMLRMSTKVVEITLPENFRETDVLPERVLVSWEVGGNKLLHCGSPSWFAGSDRFFVYVRQATNSRDFTGGMPWNGMHCNLAVHDCNSNLSVPLTRYRYSTVFPRGATAPCFSPNGLTLTWSGLSSAKRADAGLSFWGTRSLFMGTLVWVNSVPKLNGIREITDASLGSYYENYGFTPDGHKLLFAASRSGQAWFDMDLHAYDLRTGRRVNLTEDFAGWNRWASISPKGQKITWSSSRNLTNANLGPGGVRWQQELRTDLWIMNCAGNDKRRLTQFNVLDSRDNRVLGMTPYEHCFVGYTAWHPNGRQIAAVISFGNRKAGKSIVVLLDLAEAGTF